MPLSLLLHVTAVVASSTIPIVAHDLPDLDAWGASFLILGVVATAQWIHTQWRDRERLPLGLRPGLAWTPIVALLVVASFVSPASTATWVAAERIRELGREERVKKALHNDGALYDAMRLSVSRGRDLCSQLGMGWGKDPEESADRVRSSKATAWLDVLSGSNELSGLLPEACKRGDDAAIDKIVEPRRQPILNNRHQFYRATSLELHTRRTPRPSLFRRFSGTRKAFVYEDPYWIYVLGIGCTVCANAATLGGQISRKQLVRRASIVCAILSLASIFMHGPILDFFWIASVVGLGIASAFVVRALVKGQRSSGADIGLTVSFVGAPGALFLLSMRGRLPWATETGLLLACAWSVVLSIWLWWLGGRYRTLPFEDGLLASTTRGIEALERGSSWIARRSPELAQLCPVFILPVTLAVTVLAGTTSGMSINPASVPDPEALANTFLAIGAATGSVWLALQWRLRAGLPIGTRMGWLTGPLPVLPVVAMLLAAGPLAGARQANIIATVVKQKDAHDAVMLLLEDRKWLKHRSYEFTLDRAAILDRLRSGRTPPMEVVHAMTRLGGFDEHDFEVLRAAQSASDMATVERLFLEKGSRVESNLSLLARASPELRDWRLNRLMPHFPFWFMKPAAPLFAVIVGAALVLLSALASVVRPSHGAVSLAAIIVAWAVAGALRDGPRLEQEFFLPAVAVLFSVACAVVVIGLRKARRTPWTDRSLVVLVLSVPLGIAASAYRVVDASHMNIVYAVTGGWLAAVTIAHRWLAGWYRDLPFEEG
ncbi:Putative membrane protein [Sorangium cellulosum So ce56]|uniref:Membrane protein n=1 Tax=Sorangium cellulosum (strain So ce56) TaxID=448385 RepID=A9GTT1_SORC5|nr:Putative membrane protein [Sorangium cellulosum So ce56]